MNRKSLSTIFALSLIASFALGAAIGNLSLARPAQAEQTKQMQKWEYCSVSIDYKSRRYQAEICYFEDSGCRREVFQADAKGSWSDALAKAVAKLGQEGWEVLEAFNPNFNGSVYNYPVTLVYFRRLKP
jgi:hypothetical protein